MEGVRGTTDRAVAAGARRAGALVAGAAACAVLTSVLLARASARAAVVRGWLDDPGAALVAVRVDDVVEVAAVAVGLVLAGWFSVSLGAAAACATARAAGRRWTAGEHLVARYAPEVVRRALLLCAGTGLALGGGGLPALAAVDDAGAPTELGWSATISLAPRALPALGDAGVAPPGATPDDPAPAQGAAGPPEACADVLAGGTAIGLTAPDPGTAPAPGTPPTTPAPTAASTAGAASSPAVSPPSSPPTVMPSPAPSPGTAAMSTPSVADTAPPAALAVPTPPAGSVPPAPSGPVGARAGSPSDPVSPASVTVNPGDTLWAIAAAHLPADADASDVAAAWPAWYAANLAVVGDDPDVIRPGQQLAVPTIDASAGAAR